MNGYQTYIDYCTNHKEEVSTSIRLLFLRIRYLEEHPKEYYYDQSEPDAIIRFSSILYLEDGTKLELLEYHKFLIYLLGWIRVKTGLRVYSDIFLFIGKKNAKSTLAAILALYTLLTVKPARIFMVGLDYTQAHVTFDMVKGIINNTPELQARVEDKRLIMHDSGNLSIVYTPNASFIKMYPCSRAKSANGQNAHLVIFDEISDYISEKDREIISKLTSGQARPNAICLYTTTAGKTEYSQGKDEYDKAIRILENKDKSINDYYLPILYNLDPKDKYDDIKKLKKVNPALDLIVGGITTAQLEKELANAKANPIGPQGISSFKAHHANVFSSDATGGITTVEWSYIKKNAIKFKSYITEELLATYPCVGGVDLSKKYDHTVYTKYWYIPDIKKYYARHITYIPYGAITRKMSTEAVNIKQWIADKYIIPTFDSKDNVNDYKDDEDDNSIINYQYLKDQIKQDASTYKMEALLLDPNHGKYFIPELEELVPDLMIIQFNQREKMPMAHKLWLDAVYAKSIIDSNPVMDWYRSCCQFYPARDDGGIMAKKIDYKQSSKRKDGVTTSSMAYSYLYDLVQTGRFIKDETDAKISISHALTSLLKD